MLKLTQFAHVTPKTKDLPVFLVKKLEEAMVKQYTKQQVNHAAILEDKMAKAQKMREEM